MYMYVEQLEMAQQSVRGTVKFKLYSIEQITINYTVTVVAAQGGRGPLAPQKLTQGVAPLPN